MPKSIQCPTSEAVSRLRLNHGTVDSHGPAAPPQSLATTANEDDLQYHGTDRPAAVIDWRPTPLSSPAPPPTYRDDLCQSLAFRQLQSVHAENLMLLQEFDRKYLGQASLFAAVPTPISSPAPSLPNRPEDPTQGCQPSAGRRRIKPAAAVPGCWRRGAGGQPRGSSARCNA